MWYSGIGWLVKTTLLSVVFASQQPRLPVVKNEIELVDVTCNADSFNVTITLKHPFKGMLSAKDFSRECNSFGSLKKSVRLSLPTYGCGLRLSSKHGRNGELLMQYSVTLAIQQDRHLRQMADQEIYVSCQINSEEFSLNSETMMNELESDLTDVASKRSGRMKQDKVWNSQMKNTDNTKNTRYYKSVKEAKAWMEIIPGEQENENASQNDKLRVGEAAKLIVKSTLPVGIGWKVVDCTAHDGLGDSSQKLLDDRGCPIDDQIMPKPKYGPIQDKLFTKYQEAVTVFPAFKFPDRDRLHMTCMLLLCRNTCSQVDCKKQKSSNSNIHRSGKIVNEDNILDQIKIFNSVEVLAPSVNEYYKTKEYQGPISSPFEGISQDDTLCISYHKVATAFCILGILFLIAILIAAGGFLRARRSGNTLSVYTRSIFSSSSATGSSHFSSKLLHDHTSFGFSTGGLQYGRI
ncbi:uncharacterized protein LOC123671230 [Harmonia axyridis]|uniref:uncharacterized protein LOC123671230 n=1 Tax=Harmonia axyridis TaxID=115357 RepID=UPI001E276559|nr:uncharacterized protein LOC123671230 [Harmonia axyridis]XP_045460925.1 uncharacterized protein LOC123671230 [Harmonia axyridis]XP_045460926.1 uncharacterized protein LOC123671230 [Harmonia axyridis]